MGEEDGATAVRRGRPTSVRVRDDGASVRVVHIIGLLLWTREVGRLGGLRVASREHLGRGPRDPNMESEP